jgi:alpha-tubulin suppressor-like RCC1 family protein
MSSLVQRVVFVFLTLSLLPQVAAGFQHSIMLLSDGTVIAFGDTEFGQVQQS